MILYSSKEAKTNETVGNTELKWVSTSLKLNKLSLTADKSELIFFHSKQHALNYDRIFITLGKTTVDPVDIVTYLDNYWYC